MSYFQKNVECMPRGELTALQGERLSALVKYVYERVSFYRAKMDAIKLKPSDVKSIADIVKLPFTDKNDLRDNYPFGMFAMPKKDVARIHASSGTTGKMTVVGYSANDLDIWATVMARSLTCAGVTRESTVHVAYGYGMFTGGLGAHCGAEKIGAAIVPASSGNTARQITFLKDFEATTLCCTPSYAAYIAESLAEAGYTAKDLKLQSGVFGAEPWSEAMRAKIEKGLGIKAYDVYGLSEIMGPGVSIECDAREGLHVWEDHFYPEILDAGLERVEDGKSGELVFTTLTKEALPLIRYRTRDLCTLDSSPCKCGRTHARMGKILGRTDDMLIVRGINVFPSQIETVLMQTGYVSTNYQIVVGREKSTDTMEVRVELNSDMFGDEVKKLESLRDDLEKRVYSALGLKVRVRLVEQNTIPRSEGKAARVIDSRKL
ncbi:MAG: phenylacetate--CoA ligase [Clostridiales bacterium]|nr:phenylacetate--CoA ligase [Clostridiales bacterium]